MIKALSAQASLIDLNVANSPNLRIQLCLDTHTSNFNPKPLLPVHQIFTEFFSLFSFIYLVVKYYEMWIFFSYSKRWRCARSLIRPLHMRLKTFFRAHTLLMNNIANDVYSHNAEKKMKI